MYYDNNGFWGPTPLLYLNKLLISLNTLYKFYERNRSNIILFGEFEKVLNKNLITLVNPSLDEILYIYVQRIFADIGFII